MEIHHRIAKKVAEELDERGFHLHVMSFFFGNLFPDLIQSYIWRRHEYPASRDYLRKKIERLKKRPLFFSFQLGEITHYVCDYFCYPHSKSYNEDILHHMLYEIRQKVPENFMQLKLDIGSFTIEELDKFIAWYEKFRPLFDDDSYDFQIAALVSSGFLQAAQWRAAPCSTEPYALEPQVVGAA